MESPELLNFAENIGAIKETLPVPLEKDESLHVQTSREQFGNFFEEYAEALGFNRAQAREFFDNSVDLTFSPLDIKKTDLPGNILDRILVSLPYKLMLPINKPLGMTAPLKNGRFVLSVDLQSIAKQIPRFAMTGRKISGYSRQSKEARVVSLQNAITSVAEHESRHLLQYMTEREKMDSHKRKVMQNLRLLTGFTASVIVSFINPDVATVTAPVSVALLGLAAVNTRNIDIEKDAYGAAEQATTFNLNTKPFNFQVESTLPPPAGVK